MRKILFTIPFLLLAVSVYAQQPIFKKKIERDGKNYYVTDDKVEYEFIPFILKKPSIPDNRILTEEEQIEVKNALRKNTFVDVPNKKIKEGRGLVFKEMTPTRNDYTDEFNRGTVKFDPTKGTNMLDYEVFVTANYSFHKVIIPNGTTLREVNFSQDKPNTRAITGKNIHFIRCNLKNVELDPTWTYDGGLRIQERRSQVTDRGKTYLIIEQILINDPTKTWVEVIREEIIP